MYGNLKSTFGTPTNNTSFGFSNNANLFGQSTFGKTNTMGFGTPSAFGASTAPLFGSTTQHGSLFGTATQTPSFGQTATPQPAFGTSMFGSASAQPSSSGLFGSPNTAFIQQNKPTGFGFRTTSNDNFFKQPNNQVQTQQPSTGLFGQNSSNLFGTPSGFGNSNAAAAMGTVIKFTPVTGTDTMVKGSINQTISTRHHCITCMKEYENKSLEELRWEDYQANRKGPQQGAQSTGSLFGNIAQPVGTGLFGGSVNATQTNTLFGQTENKSVFGTTSTAGGFGQSNTVFGQPAQTNTSNLFGKPLSFTSNTMTTSAFPLSSSTQTNMFGTNTTVKPFGVTGQQPNLFGQQSSGFGTQSTFGSFGTQPNQQNVGLFNQNKNTPFNMGQTSGTGFGGFGQPTVQNTGLFAGNKPANTGFGGFGTTASTAPVFGQSAFGTQNNSSLFSSSFKPTTPLFGQNNTNQALGMGLNTGNTTGQTVFGNNTLKSGNMFGGNTGMFGSGFGNVPFNNSFNMTGNIAQTGTSSADANQMSAQDKIIAMSAMPFGSSNHLSNVSEVQHDLKDLTRPTNPTELSRLLNNVSNKSPVTKAEKLQPIQLYGRKLPMFNGLEQNDETIVSNFKMVNNPKRLVIRKSLDESERPPSKALCEEWNNSNSFQQGRSLDSYLNENFNDESRVSTGVNTDQDTNLGNILYKKNLANNSETNVTPKCIPNEDDEDDSNENFTEASETQEWHEKLNLENESTIKKGDNEHHSHPTGIVLTRSDYYTVPPLDELVKYVSQDGSCVVKGFTIGRVGYGSVYFPDAFDVSNLNLDELVHFRNKEITIYPDDSKKPPHGEGLNRRAQVTLDKMYPYDKEHKITITDPKIITEMNYAESLQRVCERQETRFVEYRPDTGSWVFKVDHFSRYGLRDSDESDEDGHSENKNEVSKEVPKKDFSKPVTDKEKIISDNTIEIMDIADTEESVFSHEMNRDFINAESTAYQLNVSQINDVPGLSGVLNPERTRFNLMKATFFDQEPDEPQDIGLDITSTNFGMIEMSAYVHKFSPQKLSPDFRSKHNKEKPRFINKFTSGSLKHTIFIPPKTVTLHALNGIIPRGELCFDNYNIADVTAFKGRSFKVGWGRDMTLLCLSTEKTADSVDKLFTTRQEHDYSPNFVQCIRLRETHNKHIDMYLKILETHMDCQLDNCEYSIIDGVPYFQPIKGFGMIEAHDDTATAVMKVDQSYAMSYWYLIWRLCMVLWGDVKNEDTHNYTINEIRRNLFSTWLKQLSRDIVEIHLDDKYSSDPKVIIYNILTNMSGFKVMEATELAFENNFCNLAMLLIQLPSSDEFKLYLEHQLMMWFASSADTVLEQNLIRLFMIVAGRPHLHYKNKYIFACENMDWMRTMAMYFWYFSNPTEPISHAINMYEEAYQLSSSVNQPHPLYNDKLKNQRDLMFHILKFYSDMKYSLAQVLNPVTHTKDPTDYSLSWLLSQTFQSLEINNLAQETQMHIHVNFASQLEKLGLWHWSIFVLLFIKNTQIKRSMIINVLDRHVEILKNQSEDYLKREKMIVYNFHIPSEWLDCAKANKALLHRNYKEAVHYLCYAKRWNDAHDIIIEHFFPEHFLCHDYDYLLTLLTPLDNLQYKLTTWYERGGLVLDFARLGKRYNEIMSSSDTAKIKDEISKFDSSVLRMSSRFKLFPRISYLHNICLAEMSSRIATMLRQILFMLDKYKEDKDKNREIKRLFTIPLPCDYLQEEIHKILAEYYKENQSDLTNNKRLIMSNTILTSNCNLS